MRRKILDEPQTQTHTHTQTHAHHSWSNEFKLTLKLDSYIVAVAILLQWKPFSFPALPPYAFFLKILWKTLCCSKFPGKAERKTSMVVVVRVTAGGKGRACENSGDIKPYDPLSKISGSHTHTHTHDLMPFLSSFPAQKNGEKNFPQIFPAQDITHYSEGIGRRWRSEK